MPNPNNQSQTDKKGPQPSVTAAGPRQETSVNKEQIDGKFERIKGKLKETWGKLSDNDLMLYDGKREQFLGKLKERYGLAKEEAEKQVKACEDACADGKTANSA
jgi:uncharacterized protein YjbJ (UPF0337 family)